MSKAIIVECGCKFPQQDALHGNGRRVANEVHGKDAAGLPGNMGAYRCTVCLRIHKAAK